MPKVKFFFDEGWAPSTIVRETDKFWPNWPDWPVYEIDEETLSRWTEVMNDFDSIQYEIETFKSMNKPLRKRKDV